MIDILKEILPLAMEKTIKQAPKVKMIGVEKDISDVKPQDLQTFMEENNIPEHAEFSTMDEDYGIIETNNCCLYWNESVPTTDVEQQYYIVRRFDQVLWGFLYKRLTENGYTRTGCCSSIFKKYPSVYEMYMDKDFERLEEYYLHRFKKDLDN